MVVEINFLQKEKNKQIVPSFLGIACLFLILSAATLLYIQYESAVQQRNDLQQQLDATVQQTTNDQSANDLDRLRQQFSQQVDQLRSQVFPSTTLLDRMVALLPATGYFESYTFDASTGLEIVVKANDLMEIAAYTSALEREAYITNVDVASIQGRQEASNQNVYIASYIITINNQSWIKEAN
ncbi:PilN domain-containing protein [Aquibacillus albus]|uniref:Cytoskeletal protein RodZ n=1 Tax=Aquibacillus albus TaxID=1168171 RepID=A0ABS2N1M5_9BACI|nr:PilN domain-containing protein [Aquibacillus albus]MBM7572023.1 cytoskeletal protein RodZ [Aquibacillus albus]